MNISTEDSKKYSKVLKKFDEHFDVRKNVIFERARFNKRNQLDSETAEEYITVLYSLNETCDYSALRDEMLRDRLVVGIRDTAVSEKLQLNAQLTLEGAKKKIRQREAVQEQSQQLQVADSSSHSSHSSMGEVRKPRPQRAKGGATSHNWRRKSREISLITSARDVAR